MTYARSRSITDTLTELFETEESSLVLKCIKLLSEDLASIDSCPAGANHQIGELETFFVYSLLILFRPGEGLPRPSTNRLHCLRCHAVQ